MTPRYPAEWEPQAATWLAWPHNPQNWSKLKPQIEDFYTRLISWIIQFQPVCLLVPPERKIPEASLLTWKESKHSVFQHSIATDDIWIRDYGPFFMQGQNGDYQVTFQFNAWGGKFPPWDADNNVPQQISRLFQQTLLSFAPILEGGAMEFNGKGIGMTTLDCLVGPTRNPREQLPKLDGMIRHVFGLEDLIILPQGLVGDHTDGHIDNVARFVGETRIVICTEDNHSSPNYAILRNVKRLLREWISRRPEKTWVIDELPLPPQRKHGDEIMPASYMNFIFVNGGLLVPTYDSPTDEMALEYFREQFPDRKVEGMDCRLVLQEGGSLHCLSKQQPI
jgi:agmatine deiminase